MFIVNSLISDTALNKLKQYGEVVLFSTSGMVESYLSGHADLFFTKIQNILVYAPNTPKNYINKLSTSGIELIAGAKPVRKDYPDCAIYNAAIGDGLTIHKSDFTDTTIKHFTSSFQTINVKQGMSRCSTVILNREAVLTSDRGIENACIIEDIDTLYVSPEDIILPGQKYGLFGGCCGVYENRIFINGSLTQKHDGDVIKLFLQNQNMEITELDGTPLIDVGSIICI